MNNFSTPDTKLSQLSPARPAGALPSSRTESIYTSAMASDDINEVKMNLAHVWAHYQSLEFAVSDREGNASIVENAKADPGLENDVDDVPLTTGFFATAVIEHAYEIAHAAFQLTQLGLTVPDALRELYADLDHSDPERQEPIDLSDPEDDSEDAS